jgi:hypothetical protein
VKRLLRVIWTILSSRALPPLVIGFFLVIYISIAFFSDETLTVLMAVTRRSIILAAVLGLLPLNSACRIVAEADRYLKRRRASSKAAVMPQPALYDEIVTLATPASFTELEGRLGAAGYSTRRSTNRLAAWRGVSLSLSRIVFLAGTFCLFSGILVSLTSRTVYRQAVIEGEPFPSPSGSGGKVERIIFGKSSGPILARDLVMHVVDEGSGKGSENFGVYPPSLFRGVFVYPRYLGIALTYNFSAPDFPGGFEKLVILPLYPPGREASVEIAGSPYRITMNLVKPDDGSDPYSTGQMAFRFKLLKEKNVLFTGIVPTGGKSALNGYRLAIPDARRMVLTDFIGDYGVLMIWTAGILFLVAAAVWLPVRLFLPRCEMLFMLEQETVRACSRAEGRERKHAGVFHEVLDFIESKRTGSQPYME